MVYKPIDQINLKLEEMYDEIVWVFMTIRQASVFDANNFCHHISQLTQLCWLEVIFPTQNDSIRWYVLSQEKNHRSRLSPIYVINPCSILSRVSMTLMISSRICPDKIYAWTVKIWFAQKGMLWIYMISVTAKDKCRSSASKKNFLETIYSWQETS